MKNDDIHKHINSILHLCDHGISFSIIERLNQCWFNAGPASQTMIQHSHRIVSTSRACCQHGEQHLRCYFYNNNNKSIPFNC